MDNIIKYTENLKVYTEYPMVDEIIHNLKLMMNDITLKDTDEALKNESKESIADSDIFMSINNGSPDFRDFVYTKQTFHKLNKYITTHSKCKLYPLSNKEIRKYIVSYSDIPKDYRELLVDIASEEFLESYIEKNNYYRQLNGQKPINAPDYYIGYDYIQDKYLQYFTDDIYLEPEEYLLHTPITDLTQYQLSILEVSGALDRIQRENPSALYLRFLGSRAIDIYKARKAERFEILALNGAEEIVRDRFIELFNTNRGIYLRRYYSPAYKFENAYYDKYFMIMLLIQTCNDLVAEIPEWYIRREVFDIRTCQYLLESNGIKFFPDIPLKYQISMVRAMNTLIKYKSTTKNIYDIAKVFFLKNINVYKHYIIKRQNINLNDNILMELDNRYAEDQIGYLQADAGYAGTEALIIYDNGSAIKSTEYVSSKDRRKMYTLEFLRVKIDDTINNYFHDRINYNNYDSITKGDDYWDGENDHDYVIDTILRKDFTTQCTKYLSLNSIYDSSEYMFQLIYFLNILMNNRIDSSVLKLKIPIINSSNYFILKDLIILLYCFAFKYFEAETDDLIFIKNRDPRPRVYISDYHVAGDYDPNKDEDKDCNAGGATPYESEFYDVNGGYANTRRNTMGHINGGYHIMTIVPLDDPETMEIPFIGNEDTDINAIGVMEFTNIEDRNAGESYFNYRNLDRYTDIWDAGYAVNSYLFDGLYKDNTNDDISDKYRELGDKYRYPIMDLTGRIFGFNLEADLKELNDTLHKVYHPKFDWLRGYDIREILPSYDLPIHRYASYYNFPKIGNKCEIYIDESTNTFYMWGYKTYYIIKNIYAKGIQDYIIPTNMKFSNVYEVTGLYKANKEIYDNLKIAIMDCNNQDELDVYVYVYEYLFTMEWFLDYFKIPTNKRIINMHQILRNNLPYTNSTMMYAVDKIIKNNGTSKDIVELLKNNYGFEIDDTLKAIIGDGMYPLYIRYTDFLRQKDGVIYTFYEKIMEEKNVNIRQYNMSNYIDDIISSIYAYLNTDGLDYIFYFIPSVSWGVVLKYISMVINFFKSYKTHILDVGGTIRFNDRL